MKIQNDIISDNVTFQLVISLINIDEYNITTGECEAENNVHANLYITDAIRYKKKCTQQLAC